MIWKWFFGVIHHPTLRRFKVGSRGSIKLNLHPTFTVGKLTGIHLLMFLTHPSGPRDSKLNPPAPGGRLEGPMVGWPISTWKLTVHIRWLWRETNKMCISCNMYIIVYVYGIEIIYLQEINTICCAIKVCQKRPLRHIISTKWSTRNLNCGTKPLYDFIYLYSQGSKSRSLGEYDFS